MRYLRDALLFLVICSQSVFGQDTYTYNWRSDNTYEGADSVNLVKPVQVMFLHAPIQVVPHSAALRLMRKYSVLLGSEWSLGQAYRLLQTFESIPQPDNEFYEDTPDVSHSLWQLSDQHIQDDIENSIRDDYKVVTLSTHAFTYADPMLAEIEGVRGRFFSKRLHHAIVRYVTDGGADRRALKQILEKRYGLSIDVPDYTELTQRTTKEHAGRFGEFKNEELMALVSMLEEYPTGMRDTPGLKYLVRRLDGTPHPINPVAPAIAWVNEGYIEFMESAFKEQDLSYIHRLVLHEKAHFLWAHLFDDQLKADWIDLGGWYVNADDPDGWSTTKQVEFVSAYAHAKNPNEDMAESISYYIENPDKLRSRSLAKYEFIRDRIMHGTRYISRIREDLTFQVYNLYPDVVYPGRIIRVDIQVEGGPEEDKKVTIELELHREGDFDKAHGTSIRIFSERGTYFDFGASPIGPDGRRVSRAVGSHILRGSKMLSKHSAHGYWSPDQITLRDANGNERHESQIDFGWKLYLNNPLADDTPPEYVKNSMRLFWEPPQDENGKEYQVLIASWKIFEEVAMADRGVLVWLNDLTTGTYSRRAEPYGTFDKETREARVKLKIPDYFPRGKYEVSYIWMKDVARNTQGVYFTDPGHNVNENRGRTVVDELPASIEIQTTNPDTIPPVLDLNRLTIHAEPTQPQAPNGETRVEITFRVKDNISGYGRTSMYLRDPNGTRHHFWHNRADDYVKVYFTGDPTVYETYQQIIILPVGSIPGTWGLAEMKVQDKARNTLRAKFTETIRFEVSDKLDIAFADFDGDGRIAFEDFLIFTSAFGTQAGQANFNPKFDLDGDGVVGFSDFIIFIGVYGKSVAT